MKYACVVFLGCAASLFAQSVDYKPASSSPLRIPGGGHSFVAGDVDKDGHTDPVVAENKKLSVMLGDGKGGFAPAHVPPTPVTGVAGEMLLADFNGDGVLDFAGSHHDRYEVVVMLGRLHRGQRRKQRHQHFAGAVASKSTDRGGTSTRRKLGGLPHFISRGGGQ